MHIGPLRLSHPVTLAPMEEHTNHPFRLLMKQFGASLVCTERIDAVDVARRDRRALRLLYNRPQAGRRAGHISGADAAVMAEVARIIGADGVGVGRGCLGNAWIFRQGRALWLDGLVVGPPTRAERGRALLQLVEGEFHLYGASLALRRLARTSCYFAKFLPDFEVFRAG